MTAHMEVTRVRLIRAINGTGALQVKMYADGTVDLSPLQVSDVRALVSLSRIGVANLVRVLTDTEGT